MLTVVLDSFDEGYAIGRVVGVVIAIALYVTPAVIAFTRKSQNRVPILVVDLLLGWTVVGWVAMLVWAIVSKPETASAAPDQLRRAS
jgi:hypothetical protein